MVLVKGVERGLEIRRIWDGEEKKKRRRGTEEVVEEKKEGGCGGKGGAETDRPAGVLPVVAVGLGCTNKLRLPASRDQ